MRITGLEINGFRAFSGFEEFDLDADVVLVTGANGRGKTSVFDAILWALTGSLPRLESQGEDPPIVSLYSETGQARVALQLQDEGDEIEVVRSDDGSGGRISVKVDDDEVRGEEATRWILNELWPESQLAEKASEAFTRAFTRSVYLQQDLVRQFVEADSNRDRFDAVSELVGAGRIGELNSALDTQRRTWKSDTNNLKEEIDELKHDLEEEKAKLEEIGPPEGEDLRDLRKSWRAWWSEAGNVGVEQEPPAVDESDAASAIDEALKVLSAHQRQIGRQVSEASDLLAEVDDVPAEDELPGLENLENDLEEARREKEQATEVLENARERAAKRRREKVKSQEKADELATLAELALRHVQGRCPVCQQEHSIEDTREHLESLIRRADRTEDSGELEEESKSVEEALELVSEAEQRISSIQEKLKEARELHRRYNEQMNALSDWLNSQNASVRKEESLLDAVERVIAGLQERSSDLQSHIEIGEELSIRLATVAQESRREELQEKIEARARELQSLNAKIELRDEASELADMFVDELEGATKRFVEQRLTGVSSLLQRIYSKVDPHPTFQRIRLIPSFSRRRGRLDPYVIDAEFGIDEQDPFAVMSSSQINVVALSIFFALNLGISTVPLKTVMLDDPLQSLDDINLLGFIDLVRRARGRRQILLATHDKRLSGLLRRKLRPVVESQRTRVISFRNWTRAGPEVEGTDVKQDESPMRLIAV